MQGLAVRRLTPLECARLQGFPDGWTAIPWNGREVAADTPRYRALGNAMAVNVMKWIAERITLVDGWLEMIGGDA
jgi:DNA (cytosine-5)-methyltransferase 1